MVEGIDNSMSAKENLQLYFEYQDVVDALKSAFPDKTELELQQTIISYLETHGNADGSKVDTQSMINHISQTLNVQMSDDTAKVLKKEYEELMALKNDIGVSDLAGVLDSYPKDGIKADRTYMMLLWQMLQEEIEKAAGDENKAALDSDAKGLREALRDQIAKQVEEISKKNSAGFWGKFAKWCGVVASLIGAVVSCVTAVVACATGVGTAAGVALFAAAAIMCTLAVAATASAIADEAGAEWSLGSGLGKLVAMALNEIPGVNLDEDEFAMWFAMGVQITLTIVATVLSLGAGIGSLAASGAKAGTDAAAKTAEAATKLATNVAKIGIKIGEEAAKKAVKVMRMICSILTMVSAAATLVQSGAQTGSTISSFNLSMTQAELMELRALLEKMMETRNMELELAAAILSRIFEAMRGNITDSVEAMTQDLQLMSGLNLPKA